MKLTSFQLDAHLTNKLANVYIVSGEELLLKNDAINAIHKAAKKAEFTERLRLTPEAGFDWEELYTHLHSHSLLAEKRLIELDFRDSLPNKTASQILKDYAENPNTDTILLIDTGKIDDKIAKSAWYKALEKIGIVIAIWPIPREQLPTWIINRAKKYKLNLPLDAANLLADYFEGNLIAAAQALEKIYLLKPEQVLTSTFVEAILTDESRFTVFDFVENTIAQKPQRALHILEQLQAEGTEPILILWALTRELRLLSDLAQAVNAGEAYEQLFQKHRIFAKRQPTIRRFLTQFSARDCWQALTQALEIDKMIKGAASGNVWEALQLFSLRFNKA